MFPCTFDCLQAAESFIQSDLIKYQLVVPLSKCNFLNAVAVSEILSDPATVGRAVPDAPFKLSLVCLLRPGQRWHSGHYEGLILQCKETAVVRLLPVPQQS